jgi:OHCU decarboxylase
VVIVGTSVGLALLVTAEPGLSKAVPGWAEIIFGSGITLGSLTAILLNVVFHHVGKDFGPAVAGTPATGSVRLDQVNRMSREEFVATFGRLFQGPTWVVERAYDRRPFSDTAALRTAFQEALFAGTREEQLALMAHYPDLGADRVVEGEAGEDSIQDQASAGLTRLTEDDQAEFTELTAAYRERFGIPLIVCVRDAEKREAILRDGWRRLGNSPAQEHAAALIEIAKIANHRFSDQVADANPIASARAQAFGREIS